MAQPADMEDTAAEPDFWGLSWFCSSSEDSGFENLLMSLPACLSVCLCLLAYLLVEMFFMYTYIH